MWHSLPDKGQGSGRFEVPSDWRVGSLIDWKREVENAGVAKMQGWKSQEWKSRHQTAGVEYAGVMSMESQNSRYLTLLQVGYNSR